MRLGALFVLILLLAPAASAGTSRRPDIEDPRGDARAGDAAADVLAAWLTPERDGLRFSIRVAEARDAAAARDHIYWIVLVPEGNGPQLAAVVGYGADGALRSHLTSGRASGGLDDPGTPWTRGVPFESAANGALTRLRADHGAPATFSALIPWSSDPRGALEEGAAVATWFAGATVYDRAGGQWRGAADVTPTAERTVLERTDVLSRMGVDVFPILVPGWVIPVIVGACIALGMGGGLAGALATRRPRPPAPAPRVVPVREAPMLPGERFRVEPSRLVRER